MDFQETLSTTRSQMQKQGIDLLLAFHDGGHFIEKPNAVMVLSGFKSIGHGMVIVPRDNGATLIVTPSWDAERAAEYAPAMEVIGADDIIAAIADYLKRRNVPAARVGAAGLAGMPWRVGEAVKTALGGEPAAADKLVFGSARRKTADQIAKARTAVKIAERGYGGQHAIASAMIWVQPQGSTVLWSSSG